MLDFNSLSKEFSEGLNEMSLCMRKQSLKLVFPHYSDIFRSIFVNLKLSDNTCITISNRKTAGWEGGI